MQKILRLPDVIDRTGLSRSTIYLYIKKGLFPKSISLGLRSMGFYESEVQEWVESRREGANESK